MDEFDKASDPNIIKIAILGTSEKAHALSYNFDCNLCNARVLDNLEDIHFWEPQFIMIVDTPSLENDLHELYQKSRVPITIFQYLEGDKLSQLVDDYRGLESYQRTTYVYGNIVGGTDEGVEHLAGLYDIFGKELLINDDTVTVILPEAALLATLLEENDATDENILSTIEAAARERRMPTNRIVRLMRQLLTSAY